MSTPAVVDPLVSPVTPAAIRAFLGSVPSVDEVAVHARVGSLATRSIKKASKRSAIDLAIRMTDLTTLEGMDTPGKVKQLATKAVTPDPSDPSIPSVAAVCVYPARVRDAVEVVAGTGVRVAAVATYFPSGQAPLDVKLADTRAAVEAGADEIDMVIDRGAFHTGDHLKVYEEIVATKEACGPAHLKVILETGELGDRDTIVAAASLAVEEGADFVKTSTGKSPTSATPAAAAAMLEVIAGAGRTVGIKPSGGISTAEAAEQYLELAEGAMGAGWATPATFRFGASSLLGALIEAAGLDEDTASSPTGY